MVGTHTHRTRPTQPPGSELPTSGLFTRGHVQAAAGAERPWPRQGAVGLRAQPSRSHGFAEVPGSRPGETCSRRRRRIIKKQADRDGAQPRRKLDVNARGFLFPCVFSGCGSNYVWCRRISAPSRLAALGPTYLVKGRLPGQRPLGRFRLFFAPPTSALRLAHRGIKPPPRS